MRLAARRAKNRVNANNLHDVRFKIGIVERSRIKKARWRPERFGSAIRDYGGKSSPPHSACECGNVKESRSSTPIFRIARKKTSSKIEAFLQKTPLAPGLYCLWRRYAAVEIEFHFVC